MTQQKEMSFLSHLEELRWHLVRSAVAIFLLGIVFFAFAEEVYNNFLLAHIQPDFITYQLFCDFFTFFGFESDFCNISFADKKLQSIKVTSQLMNSLWTVNNSTFMINSYIKVFRPGSCPTVSMTIFLFWYFIKRSCNHKFLYQSL